MNISKSISAKIIVSTIVMTTLLVAAIVAVSTRNFSQYAHDSFERIVLLESQVVDTDINTMRTTAKYLSMAN